MEDDSIENTKEIARGGIWGFFGNAVFYLLSFFYTVFITLAFPKDSVGLFYLAISVITLIGLIADFGLSGALMRFIPFLEGKGERGRIKSLVIAGYLFAAIFGLTLSAALFMLSDAVASFYRVPSLSFVIKFLCPVLFLNNLLNIGNAYLKSRSDMRSLAILQNFQNGSKVLITLGVFAYLGPSVEVLAAAFVASVLCAFALSVLLVRPKMKSLPGTVGKMPDLSLFAELAPYCATASIVGTIGLAFSSTTQPILAFFTVPALLAGTIAVYSMATQLGSVLNVLPASMLSLFMPVMSRLYGRKDMAGIRSISDSAQRWIMMLFLPLAAMIIVYSDDMLRFLFGSAYAGGASALSVFILAVLFSSLTSVFMVPLNVMMRLRLQIGIALLGGTILLVANVLLIWQYGMLGAVLSSLISSLAVLLAARHYSAAISGVDFSPHLGRLILAALIAFAFLFLLKPFVSPAAHSLLGGTDSFSVVSFALRLASVAYFGALAAISFFSFITCAIILRCFRKEDAEVIRMIGQKLRMPAWILQSAERMLMIEPGHGGK